MEKVNLYCFPFAGGAAASYNPFRQYLDPGIELRAIELAARGRRMREPNYNSINDAVIDVFKMLKDEFPRQPYALYGHSMGCMIAFELAYKIWEAHLPMPLHIIFSGRHAPHIPRTGKRKLHHLSDEDFKNKIKELGGTPKEFFDHPELMELFLPLLKQDFKLTEIYVHTSKPSPLEVNFTVLNGRQDEDTPEEVEAFRIHTQKNCDVHYFDGGHFFIFDEPKRVVGIINDAVRKEFRRL